jgi:hypothetical protein
MLIFENPRSIGLTSEKWAHRLSEMFLAVRSREPNGTILARSAHLVSIVSERVSLIYGVLRGGM